MIDNWKYTFPQAFTVLEKLGEGGTAEVFFARKDGLSKPLALKVFLDNEYSGLIERELEISRLLHFPGFVNIFEKGKTDNGYPFLCMEYCSGPSLETLAGKLSEEQFLSILSAISSSLYVLHSAGYVHNDLKPENIYCPPGIEDSLFRFNHIYYLKLSDFSLAYRYRENMGNAVTGTVGYMSPEMILKKEITPLSDIFSFGVMAYYLACDRLPFVSEANDPLEINAQATEGERPDFIGKGAEYSSATKELILSMMEINPADRPQSSFILLENLSKIGSPYPFRKAVRPRHLLVRGSRLTRQALVETFGKQAFSERQLDFIEQNTGYDVVAVRLLLEHNFKKGHFARLDKEWGWNHRMANTIEWSQTLSRLALRSIRRTSLSLKRLALMLALVEDIKYVDTLIDHLAGKRQQLKEEWGKLPERYIPALLHSLRLRMSKTTKRILSKKLRDIIDQNNPPAILMARLLFNSGAYRDAAEYVLKSVEQGNSSYAYEAYKDLFDIAYSSAEEAKDTELLAKIVYERALMEKDAGELPAAEKSLMRVVDILGRDEPSELAAESLKTLGDIYKETSDHESGIRVLQQARELYEKLGNRLGLSQTLNNLGNIYWIPGELDKALEHYGMALEIQRELNSEKEIASTLSNIGSIYIIQGNFKSSVSYLAESLKIKEKLGDKEEIARSFNNLGVAYFMMGKMQNALNACEKSLQLNSEIGIAVERVNNLENLAEICLQAGRLNQALDYLKQAEEMVKQLGDSAHQSVISRLTGTMLRRMGRYNQAEEYLRDALELSKQCGNGMVILSCYVSMTKYYRDVKDNALFEKFYQLALTKAKEIGDISARFYLVLLRYAIAGDEKDRREAKECLADINLPREKSLFALAILEHKIAQQDMTGNELLLEEIGSFFNDEAEDIELSRIQIAFGRRNILIGNLPDARDNFMKALSLSSQNNLLPEQWQATCELSELAFTQKDFESSFAYARQTIGLLKKISSSIQNTEQVQKLYADKKVIALLGRIKSLQTVLGKTKEAAISGP